MPEGWGRATRHREAARATSGAALAPHERRERQGRLAALREALGGDAFAAARAAGRALSLAAAIAEVLPSA